MSTFPLINAADFGAVGNGTTDDTTALQDAIDAAEDNTLIIPHGNYRVTSALDLPRSIRVGGTSRRGIDAIAKGTRLFASGFGGPVFRHIAEEPISGDIMLEGLTAAGDKANYPTGNGIELINISDCEMRNCTVGNFGSHNIKLSGGWGLVIRDCYSAQAGAANFYVDAPLCNLIGAITDGSLRGIHITANGYETTISDGMFEGATDTQVYIEGLKTLLANSRIHPTTSGANGIVLAASKCGISGNSIVGASSVVGLDMVSVTEYRVAHNFIASFGIACRANEGFGAITGNVFEGQETGLETTSGNYMGLVTGNIIGGPTHSIKHNSGSKWMYRDNYLDDSQGTPKAMTVISGTPQ